MLLWNKIPSVQESTAEYLQDRYSFSPCQAQALLMFQVMWMEHHHVYIFFVVVLNDCQCPQKESSQMNSEGY